MGLNGFTQKKYTILYSVQFFVKYAINTGDLLNALI